MGQLRQMARVTLFGSKKNAGVAFEVTNDIPSLEGQVILITGGAGGMGRETAVALARHGRPAKIYIADLPLSDAGAKQKLVDSIKEEAYRGLSSRDEKGPLTEIRFLDLNLGSHESTRRCAAEFVAQETRLDILILNAGILRMPPGVTSDGYEMHFGINYLGHVLMAKLLTPILLRTAEIRRQAAGAGQGHSRLVIIASEGYAMAPKGGIVFDKLKTDCSDMGYFSRYGQSKLALIHHARKLAKLHPEIQTVSVHPGRVMTGIADGLMKDSRLMKATASFAPFKLFAVPANVGARNALWASTSADIVPGKYYEPVGVPDMERRFKPAMDSHLAKRLWDWTENELKTIQPLE